MAPSQHDRRHVVTIDTDQRDRLTMLLDPTTPPAPRPRPVRATGVQGMRTKLVETVDPTSQLTGEFTARVSD